MIAQLGATGLSRAAEKGAPQLAPQDLDEFLEFQSHLMNELLTLIQIHLRIVAGKAISGAADGKSLLIQEAADLANDQHVLALVVAAIAAPLHRFELREFLLPVAQYMGFDAAQIAHFADREVALSRDRRQFAIVAWFQHMPRRAPLVSDPGGMSQRGGR